jgi:hypothetical protein
VCKRFLSRDDNLGSVLSPQIRLIEAVELWKKEGRRLLLRYTTLGVTHRTRSLPRLSLGRLTVLPFILG